MPLNAFEFGRIPPPRPPPELDLEHPVVRPDLLDREPPDLPGVRPAVRTDPRITADLTRPAPPAKRRPHGAQRVGDNLFPTLCVAAQAATSRHLRACTVDSLTGSQRGLLPQPKGPGSRRSPGPEAVSRAADHTGI
jgi:hypothetical protein